MIMITTSILLETVCLPDASMCMCMCMCKMEGMYIFFVLEIALCARSRAQLLRVGADSFSGVFYRPPHIRLKTYVVSSISPARRLVRLVRVSLEVLMLRKAKITRAPVEMKVSVDINGGVSVERAFQDKVHDTRHMTLGKMSFQP